MKKLISLLLLLCVTAQAQSIITGNITLTNAVGTTNGCTITINGLLRFFTNNVNSAATQIGTNNTFAGSASNLYNAYLVAPQGNVFVSYPNASNVQWQAFPNGALTMSISAGWGTLTLSTNALVASTVVRVPLAALGNYERTNVESGLVGLLQDSATTNQVAAGAVAFSNYVDITSSKIVTGANTFSGAGVYSNAAQVYSGGTVTNATIVNSPAIGGTVTTLIGGGYFNPFLTNGFNYGNPFRSPGGGTSSEQMGVSASARTNFALAWGRGSIAKGISSLSIGDTTEADGYYSTALGGGFAGGYQSIAIGVGATVNAGADFSVMIGAGATTFYSNTVALGYAANCTTSNQIALGAFPGLSPLMSVWIPGTLQVDTGMSNTIFLGWAKLQNALYAPRYNNTSLANGNNAAISVSTNIYVKVSGPSGAFAINGIVGGTDGRIIILENATGQTMTIANDSGVDPAATNRIYTGTGADVAMTGNPQIVELFYDSGSTHWVMFTPATATIASSVSANTANIGTLTLTNALIPSALPYRAGISNLGSLSLSQAILFSSPFPTSIGTNYTPSVSFIGAALVVSPELSYNNITTNGFTVNLSTGINGAETIEYTAWPFN